MRTLIVVLLLVVCLCCSCFGQASHYNGSITNMGNTNGYPYCQYQTNRNCWQLTAPIPGNIGAASVDVDPRNEYVVIKDINNNLWTLPESTNSGQATPVAMNLGTDNLTIGNGGPKNLVALQNSSVGIAPANTNCSQFTTARPIKKMNSTKNGWIGLTGCLTQVSAADPETSSAPGAIAGVNSSNGGHGGYISTDGGQSWYQFSNTWCDGTNCPGGYNYIHAVSATLVYAVGFDNNLYWIQKVNGVWTLGCFSNGVAMKSVTGSAAVVYAKTLSDPGYVYYMDFTAPSPTWMPLYVGTTYRSLAGAELFVFAIAGASNTGAVYHLKTTMPTLTFNTNGYYDCTKFGLGWCPTGSVHTVKSTAKWAGAGGYGGTTGIVASTSGCPACTLSISTQDIGTGCDLLFGNPTSPECQPASSGNADCSQMGTLATFQEGGGLSWQLAITYATYTGHVTSFLGGGKGFTCGASSTGNCSQGSTMTCPAYDVFVDSSQTDPVLEDVVCSYHQPWREHQFAVFYTGVKLFCTGALGSTVVGEVLNWAEPLYNEVPMPQPCI